MSENARAVYRGDAIDVPFVIHRADGIQREDLTGKTVTVALERANGARTLKRSSVADEVAFTDPGQGEGSFHLTAKDTAVVGERDFSVRVAWSAAGVPMERTAIIGAINVLDRA